LIFASLNSVLTYLGMELTGRTNLGEEALDIKCLRLLDTVLNVPSDSPERLSFISVLTILPFIEE